MKGTKFIISFLLCIILVVSMAACSSEPAGIPIEGNLSLTVVSTEDQEGVTVITTSWTNGSSSSVSFGKNGILYEKKGDSFEEIGKVIGDNMMSILQAGEMSNVKYTPVDCTLETGKTYKIEAVANYQGDKESLAETVSAEFELK